MSSSLSFTLRRAKALTKAERSALVGLAHEHGLDLYVRDEANKAGGCLAWGSVALDPDALVDEVRAAALLEPLTALRAALPGAELDHEDDLGVVVFDDAAGRYVVGEGAAGSAELPSEEGYVRALSLPAPAAKKGARGKTPSVPGVPTDVVARLWAALATATDYDAVDQDRIAAAQRLASESDPTQLLGVLVTYARERPVYGVGDLVGLLADRGADPRPWVAQALALFHEKRRKSGSWWNEITHLLRYFAGGPDFDDAVARYLLDTPADGGKEEERFYTAAALLGDLGDPRRLGVALHRLRRDRGVSVLTAERVEQLSFARRTYVPPAVRAPWRPMLIELLGARQVGRARSTLLLELAQPETSREACQALWAALREEAFDPLMQRFYEGSDREATRGLTIPWPAAWAKPRAHSMSSATKNPELYRLNLAPEERQALEAEEDAVIAAELARA